MHALVISGSVGSGKTSVLAECAAILSFELGTSRWTSTGCARSTRASLEIRSATPSASSS